MTNSQISKIAIQALWIGESLPRMQQLSILSFLAHGHDFHLYAYQPLKGIPAGTTVKDAREILDEQDIFKYSRGIAKGSYAAFANLFRLKLLLEKGGIWSDLDYICLKSFELKAKYVFVSQHTKEGVMKVNNSILQAPANDSMLAECYSRSQSINKKTLRWRQNGSDMLSQCIDKYNLHSFVKPPEFSAPINWWNWKTLIQADIDFKLPKESYAIHLWNECWRRQYIADTTSIGRLLNRFFHADALPMNKIYDKNTLYGSFQKEYLKLP